MICPSALVIILNGHPDFSWFQYSCRVAKQFLRFDSGSHVASSGGYPRQETRYNLFPCLPLPSSLIQDGFNLKLLVPLDKQNLGRRWLTGIIMPRLQHGHMKYIVYFHALRKQQPIGHWPDFGCRNGPMNFGCSLEVPDARPARLTVDSLT